MEKGDLTDRELTHGQADVQYDLGKLTTALTWRYEEETNVQELRERQYFYVSTQRDF